MICIRCNREMRAGQHECVAKPKFTPGPWQIELLGHTLRVTTCEYEDYNDDVAVIGRGDSESNRADARLIAAAPKLYAKLEELLGKVNMAEARSIAELLAEARGEK